VNIDSLERFTTNNVIFEKGRNELPEEVTEFLCIVIYPAIFAVPFQGQTKDIPLGTGIP
jgi:hypothetical protein